MEMKAEEVSINGVVYVPKDSVECSKLNTEDYCIVRTYSAGVFAGNVVERDGKEVKLANVRRLWYWNGAKTLSHLAIEGTSQPNDCKFAMEIPELIVTEAIEIIPCTEKAIKSIKGVYIWK